LSIEIEGSLVFNPASFESFMEQKMVGILERFFSKIEHFCQKRMRNFG
jgi:hypothetical protein